MRHFFKHYFLHVLGKFLVSTWSAPVFQASVLSGPFSGLCHFFTGTSPVASQKLREVCPIVVTSELQKSPVTPENIFLERLHGYWRLLRERERMNK